MAYDTTVELTDLQLRRAQTTLATPSRTGAGKGSALYACYIVRLSTARVEDSFGFDIPPVQIRLDEDAAADVAALQDGGFFSDERGQYFKMLNVSGTFGFRPTPQRGPDDPFGFRRSIDQAAQQAVTLRGSGRGAANQIPKGEYTGYERYVRLHNLIRKYWDLKRVRSSAGDYVFVWADWKMGEVYIAQPLRFNRDRSAPSGRFKVHYSFVLRLLSPLWIVQRPDFLSSPANRVQKQSYFDQLKDASRKLRAANELISNFITSTIDFGFDIAQDVYQPINEMVGTLQSVLDTAKYLRKKTQQIFNFPLETMRAVYRTCLDAAGTIRQLENDPTTWVAGYKSLFSMEHAFTRTARLISGAFVSIKAAIKDRDINEEAQSMGRKYRQWDPEAAVDDNIVAFGERLPADKGSNTSLGFNKIPSGARIITLQGGVSIKALATEYLGSAGRWKEIVLLNKLRPPYISRNGDGITVLRPGDPVRLPAHPDSSGDVNNVFSTRDDIRLLDEYRYGRDLLIDEVTKDFFIDDRGDLATVAGRDNLIQAMHIKIWTKPGELKAHRWFGFGGRAGQGVSLDVLSGYHFQLRSTLLSDTRISNIRSMAMELAEGDILQIKAILEPKAQDDAVFFAASSPLPV